MAQPSNVLINRFVKLPLETRIQIVNEIYSSAGPVAMGNGNGEDQVIYNAIIDRFKASPDFVTSFSEAWLANLTFTTTFDSFEGYGGYNNPDMTKPFTHEFRSYGQKLRIELRFPSRKRPTYENIRDVVLAAQEFVLYCSSLKFLQLVLMDAHKASNNGQFRYRHLPEVVEEIQAEMWEMEEYVQSKNAALTVERWNVKPEKTGEAKGYADD